MASVLRAIKKRISRASQDGNIEDGLTAPETEPEPLGNGAAIEAEAAVSPPPAVTSNGLMPVAANGVMSASGPAPPQSRAGKPNGCPYAHGTVYVAPYPGYVHGTNPVICPKGCVPDPSVLKMESLEEMLIREALEWQNLIHKEWSSEPGVKEKRISDILQEIKKTGTYTHTFRELEYGIRVAWRNAPKCANRKFWNELKLVDRRSAKTNRDMYDAVLEYMDLATTSGATDAILCMFAPRHPLTGKGGAKVWNTQIIRYAAYVEAGAGGGYDRNILGDPANLAFTTMVIKHFGWKPPSGQKGRFDILPLVLQVDPDQTPEVFELPQQYVSEVPIEHPKYPWFASMKLKWYAVPAVSCLEVHLGGLVYTGAPFSGWYADTEVVRDFADEGRYNILPDIAWHLGLPTADDSTLWKDRCLQILDEAVLFSYQQSRMGMVDHHTLMRQFWDWYHQEKAARGYCPGNWKWIITPLAASQSKCYLGLNKMTEFTLKPAYVPGESWTKPLERHLQRTGWTAEAQEAADVAVEASGEKVETDESSDAARAVVIAIVYATVSGKTKAMAEELLDALRTTFTVTLQDMEQYKPVTSKLPQASAIIVLSSTYGSGVPPASAARFLKHLQEMSKQPDEALAGKPFAVFGAGSSAYPRFCAAADLVNSLMLGVGAESLLPVGKGDALGDQLFSFRGWAAGLLKALAEKLPTVSANFLAVSARFTAMLKADEETAEPTYNVIVFKSTSRLGTDHKWQQAPVLEVRPLKDRVKTGQSTVLVRFDIANLRGAGYMPGDHVAVLPNNRHVSGDVEKVARHLGIVSLDEVFDLQAVDLKSAKAQSRPFPTPISFRSALTDYLALLDKPTRSSLLVLSQFASGMEVGELKKLGTNQSEFQLWQRTKGYRWADIFDVFPTLRNGLPFAIFLDLVPPIQARYYSVASSPWHSKDEAHLVVGHVAYQLPGGAKRVGHCSDYLNFRVHEGDLVRIHLVKAPTFQLPLNTNKPVVMIGTGTGFAPHRGFLQHRKVLAERGVLGPAILLFGCRSSDDQLCRDEVQKAVVDGVLTYAYIAYSREPGKPKKYVQDLLAQYWDTLGFFFSNQDLHVYICGDNNMSAGVSAAIQKQIGMTRLGEIVNTGRWHEDVFGIVHDVGAALGKGEELAKIRIALEKLLSLGGEGDMEGIEAHLSNGFDINASDSEGNTALHLAAWFGHVELAKVLVAHRASLTALNKWNSTPLAVAFTRKQQAAVEYLKSIGAPRTSDIHELFYPLHLAAATGDVDSLRALLDKGASIEATDFQGATALLAAAVGGHEDAVRLLLLHGANVNTFDRYGHTALEAVLTFDHKELTAVLRSAGARMTASESDLTASWPSLATWSALQEQKGAGFQEALALVQAGWAFLSQEGFPLEQRAALTRRGVDLFHVLFKMTPVLLELFPFKDPSGVPIPHELEKHALVVMNTIGIVIQKLSNVEECVEYVKGIVRRHFAYGVVLDHYAVLMSCIIVMLEDAMGNKWTTKESDAWRLILGVVESTASEVYKEAGKT